MIPTGTHRRFVQLFGRVMRALRGGCLLESFREAPAKLPEGTRLLVIGEQHVHQALPQDGQQRRRAAADQLEAGQIQRDLLGRQRFASEGVDVMTGARNLPCVQLEGIATVGRPLRRAARSPSV